MGALVDVLDTAPMFWEGEDGASNKGRGLSEVQWLRRKDSSSLSYSNCIIVGANKDSTQDRKKQWQKAQKVLLSSLTPSTETSPCAKDERRLLHSPPESMRGLP